MCRKYHLLQLFFSIIFINTKGKIMYYNWIATEKKNCREKCWCGRVWFHLDGIEALTQLIIVKWVTKQNDCVSLEINFLKTHLTRFWCRLTYKENICKENDFFWKLKQSPLKLSCFFVLEKILGICVHT